MASIPEYVNHYLSKIFGVRLITTKDFNHIYDAVVELNKYSHFYYLPNTIEVKKRVKEVYALITPMKAREANKIRIGNQHDGGYVCLDYLQKVTSAVSLGISDDVSWDLAMADLNIDVYQYDYSVNGPPVHNNHFKFYKLKVAGTDGPGAISLDSIVKNNKLCAPASNFLKIDIEGDEWETFLSSSEEVLGAFSQIVCEFHNFHLISDIDYFEKIKNTLCKLKDKFQVIHVHGNNYTPLLICPGVGSLPQVMEISFASRSIFSFEKCNETFPGPLDAPCDPHHPDYFIDLSEI